MGIGTPITSEGVLKTELSAVVRDALQEYGCTDYGTWDQQTEEVTTAVIEFLTKRMRGKQ